LPPPLPPPLPLHDALPILAPRPRGPAAQQAFQRRPNSVRKNLSLNRQPVVVQLTDNDLLPEPAAMPPRTCRIRDELFAFYHEGRALFEHLHGDVGRRGRIEHRGIPVRIPAATLATAEHDVIIEGAAVGVAAVSGAQRW